MAGPLLVYLACAQDNAGKCGDSVSYKQMDDSTLQYQSSSQENDKDSEWHTNFPLIRQMCASL
jgi:hypothetical protein